MPGNPTRDIPQIVGTVQRRRHAVRRNGGIQNLTLSPRRTGRAIRGSRSTVARLGVVCHRRPQHEVRLPGRVHRVNQSYFTNDTHLQYRVNNGVPNQLTMDLKPFKTGQRTR